MSKRKFGANDRLRTFKHELTMRDYLMKKLSGFAKLKMREQVSFVSVRYHNWLCITLEPSTSCFELLSHSWT